MKNFNIPRIQVGPKSVIMWQHGLERQIFEQLVREMYPKLGHDICNMDRFINSGDDGKSFDAKARVKLGITADNWVQTIEEVLNPQQKQWTIPPRSNILPFGSRDFRAFLPAEVCCDLCLKLKTRDELHMADDQNGRYICKSCNDPKGYKCVMDGCFNIVPHEYEHCNHCKKKLEVDAVLAAINSRLKL